MHFRPAAAWFPRSFLAAACLLGVVLGIGPAGHSWAQSRPAPPSKPEGEMRWALYVTLSPVWFDPGEFQGLTAFWVLYAIHDALVKPMPGNLMTPSLAESWTVSADQRVYEFKLREGLVMEANEAYWRKVPSVKRLVFKSVPDSTTRAAMLKRDEVDVAYLLDVPQALEVKRDPTLKLAFSGGIATFFLDFLDQWDPKSPWADQRVRLAANSATDRKPLS